MKNHILQLIRDDIKITALVHTLDDLNIDAQNYYLGNSRIIFSFMGIEDTPETQDAYNKLIEYADLKRLNTSEKLEEFAEWVYEGLGRIGEKC